MLIFVKDTLHLKRFEKDKGLVATHGSGQLDHEVLFLGLEYKFFLAEPVAVHVVQVIQQFLVFQLFGSEFVLHKAEFLPLVIFWSRVEQFVA